MEINFYLPLQSRHRRRQNNKLLWIFSCFGEKAARLMLNDRRDKERHKYIVVSKSGTVIQDPRQAAEDDDDMYADEYEADV